MTWALILILAAACGFARRWQGVAKETWPLKRAWRMLVLWWPVVGAYAGFAYLLGAPVWVWGAGLIPYLWSWAPGKYNSFAIWNLLGQRVATVYAEGIQGALGGLTAGAVIWGGAYAQTHLL